MSQNLIAIVEKNCLRSKVPAFHVGDTVDVHTRIREGAKTRTQIFNGVVIARGGGGINETLTVRRIVNKEGVERIFMLHSPLVLDITVKRRGKVRRAKLYYLRNRIGKARRVRELRTTKSKTSKAAGSASSGDGKSKPELVGASS